jgi:Domain of unknown function (DUF222)/HNH endonuclease
LGGPHLGPLHGGSDRLNRERVGSPPPPGTVLTLMSDTLLSLSFLGPDVIGAVAGMSTEEHRSRLTEAFRRVAADEGEIIAIVGEVDRCQSYRDEGATSTEAWLVQRFGVSAATARSLTRLAQKAWDMPHLVGSLCAGDLSLDKVKAVSDVTTPETDRELRDQALEYSVRELTEIARTTAAKNASPPSSDSAHDQRYLRFNDEYRTLTTQLPPPRYAEVKAGIEAWARGVPTDGDTPWDQRCADAFIEIIRSSSGTDAGVPSVNPFFVIAHVPLSTLVDRSGQSNALAGELEHIGLIDSETMRRIACDATIAIAVDDEIGHTMYEGRARRFPTKAQRREVLRRDRHCRFPGCTSKTFVDVHHIVLWEAGGLTDLSNLALLCLHHHHLVHSNGWSMTGNANQDLTIVGPTGRVMTSRPSPLWTRATDGARIRSGAAGDAGTAGEAGAADAVGAGAGPSG